MVALMLENISAYYLNFNFDDKNGSGMTLFCVLRFLIRIHIPTLLDRWLPTFLWLERGGAIRALKVKPSEEGNVIEVNLNINVHRSNEKKIASGSL